MITQQSVYKHQQTETYLPFQKHQQSKRIQNGYKTSEYYKRFLKTQVNLGIAISVSIFLNYLYYQYDFQLYPNSFSYLLLIMTTIFLIFIIFGLIFRYKAYNQLKLSQLHENQMSGIVELIFQIVLMLFQPYPFFNSLTFDAMNYQTNELYKCKYNYLLVVFSFLRVFMVHPIVFRCSKFFTPRTSRICRMYGFNPSFRYSLKCMFKQRPIQLVLSWLISNIIIFSLSFRISERGAGDQGVILQSNFYINSLWLTLISMNGLGYGDIYPATALGRIVGIFCMFLGGFTVSLLVIIITNIIQLNPKQQKALQFIKRLSLKKQLKIVAGLYIRETLWRVWKLYKLKTQKYAQESIDEKNIKSKLISLRFKIKHSYFRENIQEGMIINFNRIKKCVENLNYNSNALLKFFNQKFISKITYDQQNDFQ